MTTRRTILGLGALAIAATAPTRVTAATDVEGVEYGGETSGNWGCGPAAHATYAGLGARVRVSENRARFGGAGYVGELAAAGEHESVKVEPCSSCDPKDEVTPPPRIMFGAHARAGYQWHMFGVEGGATGFQGWRHNTDAAPDVRFFPDLELKIGPQNVVRGVLGVGSPTVTMLRRPGAYVGADVAAGPVNLEARFGKYRAGPGLHDSTAYRGDLVALFPVTPSLKLRLGASASSDDEGLGGEGSIGLRGAFGD